MDLGAPDPKRFLDARGVTASASAIVDIEALLPAQGGLAKQLLSPGTIRQLGARVHSAA